MDGDRMDSLLLKCEIEHYKTLLQIKRDNGGVSNVALNDAIVTSRTLLESMGVNVDGITIS